MTLYNPSPKRIALNEIKEMLDKVVEIAEESDETETLDTLYAFSEKLYQMILDSTGERETVYLVGSSFSAVRSNKESANALKDALEERNAELVLEHGEAVKTTYSIQEVELDH